MIGFYLSFCQLQESEDDFDYEDMVGIEPQTQNDKDVKPPYR